MYAHTFLSQNLNLPIYCRPESFAHQILQSGKFSTFLPLDWLHSLDQKKGWKISLASLICIINSVELKKNVKIANNLIFTNYKYKIY